MRLGQRQDHLAGDFLLRGRQTDEGFQHLALGAGDGVFPAFFPCLDGNGSLAAEAQNLRLDFQPLGYPFRRVTVGWNGHLLNGRRPTRTLRPFARSAKRATTLCGCVM